MTIDERTYHVERARAELDAAYRASRADIAGIHLRLCALHMARARLRPPSAAVAVAANASSHVG